MKKEKKPCPVCGEMFVNVGVHMRHKHKPEDPIEELKDLEPGPKMDRLGFLKAEVEATADALGHELEPWEEHPGWAKTKCSLCGAECHAAPHPSAGTLPVDGAALREKCE